MDWTSFAIAALGIVGTLMAPLIGHHLEGLRQRRVHEREDLATLRLKLEETYSEIYRLQGQANASSVAVLNLLKDGGGVPQQPAFDLSRLRVNVGLYFPDCTSPFEEYDREMERAAQQMRADFNANPVGAMGTYTLLGFTLYGSLATKLRGLLDESAVAISMGKKATSKK